MEVEFDTDGGGANGGDVELWLLLLEKGPVRGKQFEVEVNVWVRSRSGRSRSRLSLMKELIFRILPPVSTGQARVSWYVPSQFTCEEHGGQKCVIILFKTIYKEIHRSQEVDHVKL